MTPMSGHAPPVSILLKWTHSAVNSSTLSLLADSIEDPVHRRTSYTCTPPPPRGPWGLPYASTGYQIKAKQDMLCAAQQGRLDGTMGLQVSFFFAWLTSTCRLLRHNTDFLFPEGSLGTDVIVWLTVGAGF
jgi:hypothetical protein